MGIRLSNCFEGAEYQCGYIVPGHGLKVKQKSLVTSEDLSLACMMIVKESKLDCGLSDSKPRNDHLQILIFPRRKQDVQTTTHTCLRCPRSI